MSLPVTAWLAVPVAYLLGSISFSYLIVHVLRGVDIRTLGSGSAGATNVLRVAGVVPALAALMLDVAKGVVAVVAARFFGASEAIVALVAVVVVAGHIYPVFFGFRGGKGVATAAGALGALVPVPTVLVLPLFVLVVVATRFVSLGSMVAALVCPLLVLLVGLQGWLGPGWTWSLAGSGGIGGLIVYKHGANLRRLLDGTEAKIGQRPEAKSGQRPEGGGA